MAKLQDLKDVVTVYLLMSGGDTRHLGSLFLKSIDCLEDLQDGKNIDADIDLIIINIVGVICDAALERLKKLMSVDAYEAALNKLKIEPEVKPYLVLLSNVLKDLGVETRIDYAASILTLTKVIDAT